MIVDVMHLGVLIIAFLAMLAISGYVAGRSQPRWR